MNRFYNIFKYALNQKLFSVGMMIFFFIVFDGILMYLAPIVITDAGISASLMGLIIGSSSIAGMLFDFFLYRAFKEIHYRRMFLLMFIMALLFPLFLFGGNAIIIYLFAMAVWGVYYDLYNIGTLDFVERTTEPVEHASNFGVLRSFEGLGYLLAPFFASVLLIFLHPGPVMFFAILIPLIISFLFYASIALNPIPERSKYKRIKENLFNFFQKLVFRKKIILPIFPLLVILFINLIDTAIWTFGPIFSEQIGYANGILGGAFMTAFALPPILMGWTIGAIVKKVGNIYAAQGAIIVSSIFFILVGLTTSPLFLLLLIFAASFFLSIGIPSINAVFTKYINSAVDRRKETETVQDLFTNIGTTTGPIIGGYMAEYLGFANAFIALGVLGIAVAIFLFVFIPRKQ